MNLIPVSQEPAKLLHARSGLVRTKTVMTMAFTGQSRNLHIMAGIFSMDNLYLEGKTPLLVGDMLVISCQKQKAVHAGLWVRIPI